MNYIFPSRHPGIKTPRIRIQFETSIKLLSNPYYKYPLPLIITPHIKHPPSFPTPCTPLMHLNIPTSSSEVYRLDQRKNLAANNKTRMLKIVYAIYFKILISTYSLVVTHLRKVEAIRKTYKNSEISPSCTIINIKSSIKAISNRKLTELTISLSIWVIDISTNSLSECSCVSSTCLSGR